MLRAAIRYGAKATAAATLGTVGVLGAEGWLTYKRFQLPPEATGPTAGVCSSDGRSAGALPAKHIIFLGDSLVTGVGCNAELREGPTLPRHVAQVVAHQLQQDVGWTAIGSTGAAAVEGARFGNIQKELFPALQREVQARQSVGRRVDAVVIMCGLNDIKECFLWAQPSKHPGAFRRGLENLVLTIREEAGVECAVFVPMFPMLAAPRFNRVWPLSECVRHISRLWEEQKQSLPTALRERCGASDRPAVIPVEAPATVPEHLFCADGMHPNDDGYRYWGDAIAQSVVAELRARLAHQL